MIILTTSYNCEKFVEKSLLSIMGQRFKDFKCYITDDLSTDNTVDVIRNTISGDDRFILIENKQKMYQPGNYDQVIRGLDIPDNEICVEIDGDDWMTSGSFKYHDGRPGFANPPRNFTNIRKQTFTLSHMRTWKSWLWKKIKEKDLKDNDGNYWSVAGDLSFMYPMLEMSGEKHFKYISETLYIYNESNPLNDHKVNMSKVSSTVNVIRNKSEYELI